MATTEYTSEDLNQIVTLCDAAIQALIKTANARHLCETLDPDPNTCHSFARDAQDAAKVADGALFALRQQAIALTSGLDITEFCAGSEPAFLRKLATTTSLARSRVGGTPAVDWGHAAELSLARDILARWAAWPRRNRT